MPVRDALIRGDSVSDLWPVMLGLLAAGLVLIPVGVRVFSWGEHYAKRTGA